MYYPNELYHHGILGMKWGIRRFQNPDGTLTAEGKIRYGRKKTVFISGSSKTQDPSSPYYRRHLPKTIRSAIESLINENANIIVGDAPGIDRQVQDFLNEHGYDNVVVYGPGESVRYSANSRWKTHPVPAPEYEEGSKEWLAKKDIAMERAATEGLAVILDEGAKATRKNVERLQGHGKKVNVYELSKDGKRKDRWV